MRETEVSSVSAVGTQVTKRALGESYIAATGLLLGLVLVGQLAVEGRGALLWLVAGIVPVAVLVASVRWFDHLEFSGEQVWTVAVHSALALGAGSIFVVLLDTVSGVFAFTERETFLLVTTLGTVTVGGALVGVVRELQSSNRQLTLRNQVLHRVLRHNLRNDMSVVLCLLDEIAREADTEQRERLEAASRRIESLVDLTDTVRQVNVTVTAGGPPSEPVDLAELVDRRVERLEAEHPVAIETDLPDAALVRANGEFGLVLDKLVQSAVTDGTRADLGVSLRTEGRTVALRVADRNRSIPDADVSAVTNGAETPLEHGLGVELWLVYWLVEANDGDIAVETVDGTRQVEIRLDRAVDGFLPSRLA